MNWCLQCISIDFSNIFQNSVSFCAKQTQGSTMFSISYNGFPCSYFGSYYCTLCKQRFQTEKNFKRHNNSRKHIKQMQLIDGNPIKMNHRSMEFDLLPNDVFEYMVTDLAGQMFEKDTFFNDIKLLDRNELDLIETTPKYQQQQQSPNGLHAKMENNPIVHRSNQPSIRRIPAIYPCLTCFQLLDSQENFDAHMLKAHFNGSFETEKE